MTLGDALHERSACGLWAPDRLPERGFLARPSPLKRIARWTTSVHYDAVGGAGVLLVERLAETARFGDRMGLERVRSAGSLRKGE